MKIEELKQHIEECVELLSKSKNKYMTAKSEEEKTFIYLKE